MNSDARTDTNGTQYEYASGGIGDRAEELRQIVGKAEELLESLGSQGVEVFDELRQKATDTIRTAKERLGDIDYAARNATRRAVATADEYVTGHPWSAVAVAALVGAVVAAVLARRI
jgi:ElaB/YqjD/DUF883 family membrane-anchored ribosome-binding protein